MRKWQERRSVLDLYDLFLAAVLFISPWLFKLTNGPGKVDLWVTSAVIVVISFAAMIAYRDWEEWLNVLLGLAALLRLGCFDSRILGPCISALESVSSLRFWPCSISSSTMRRGT